MNHLCQCGHLPDEHFMDRGRCGGECFDPDYGTFACLCYGYEKDSDD